MSYHLIDEASRFGGFACGSACGCTACTARCCGYGETYIPDDDADEPGDLSEAPAAAPPAEAALRRAYERDCRGVRVLQTLSRQAMTPEEMVRSLERKLTVVPRLVEGHGLLRRLAQAAQRGAPPAAVQAASRRVLELYPELIEFPFPPGYAVQSVDRERATVRCQLAKARWELAVFQRTGRVPGRLLRRS